MGIDFRIDKIEIYKLLDELIERLRKANTPATINIYGGVAMMYHRIDTLRRTADIDATFAPYNKIINIANRMREELKLKHVELVNGWLNNNIAQSGVLPNKKDEKAIVYYHKNKISVKIASKECLLAMKAISAVERRSESDYSDFEWLCKKLKINNVNKLLTIIEKYWSNKQLQDFNIDYFKKQWTLIFNDFIF